MALNENTLDRVIRDLTEAHRLDERSPQLRGKLALAYCQRAELFYGQRKYDRAISDLDDGLRLDPALSDGYFLRGLAHMDKGDNERAITDQTEAIRLDPKLARAYGARGMAYMKMGDGDRAKADYVEALKLDPDLDVVRNNLASMHFKLGAILYAAARMSVACADRMGFVESMKDRLKNSGRRSCDIELEQALAELDEACRLNPGLRDSVEDIRKKADEIASMIPRP